MDDINFLRTHGTQMDTEVFIDSTHRTSGSVCDYEIDTPPLQNVTDIKLKLAHVPPPHNNVKSTVLVFQHQTAEIRVDVHGKRYTEEELASAISTETVVFTFREGRFEVNTPIFFRKGANHPRLCRLLGLPAYQDCNVVDRFPIHANFHNEEIVKLNVADIREFVVPVGPFKRTEETLVVPIHPIFINRLRISLRDRDGEPLDTVDHWFVLHFKVLSVYRNSLPIDFQTKIAAPNYNTTGGLYGNGSSPTGDSEDTGFYYSDHSESL